MDQNNKLLVLIPATIYSIGFISIAFMTLVWVWTFFYRQETRERRGPGINIKEL